MQSKQENHLYEYAVIRYVPRVEREEFINVGLVMMCKRKRWVRTAITTDMERIMAFAPDTDLELLKQQLASFERVANGKAAPIGQLEAHERFRWLTAVRSASIQTSRPHPGKCEQLDDEFDRLFSELV
ncbi:MAG: DUF3037 domain-containing protein [Lachnoclostridium sp.]|nr:DUF3037 domain-containing protein [Lachnoclostridium sp.]